MLKQQFDEQSILKVITGKDIWRWKVLDSHKNSEEAAEKIAKRWEKSGIEITGLNISNIKGKQTFITQSLEDTLAIKLVDRYIRRVYKIRQSDRTRMIKQIITLMQDTGDFSFIKFDVKDCYESINLKNIINKLKGDFVLSPTCTSILEQINNICINLGANGLPRGLPISSTLAELYLEKLDSTLASDENIIYSARYVDDCIVMTPSSQVHNTKKLITNTFNELTLYENHDKSLIYKTNQINESLEILGYSLNSVSNTKEQNNVHVKISKNKINKIKSRVMLSFLNYKHLNSHGRFKLFKDRIYFLSTLRVVKKSKNGNLLSGNAHNYILSDLSCLKEVDRFYHGILHRNRSLFTPAELNQLNKIYFYSNAKNKKIMKVTKNRANILQKAWSNSL